MLNRPVEVAGKPLRGLLFKIFGDKQRRESSSPAATAGDRKPSIEYRADIDGLRAIAVLLVLIFHGGLAFFPSGFIGVDIFFVISGYLTTAIIMKSLNNGTFTFSGFYTRRIWRLQPAVIALLVVTLMVTTLLYLPDDYVDFLKSEKYTSLIISNQYFSKVTTGYATPDAASLPLLHTWSLAIEWQWYLALPLGLWLLYRYLAKSLFKAVVLGLTLAAMALALYLSYSVPDKNYYFFTARIFELMIGSCAVIFSTEKFRLNRLSATLVCALSLATILYCATLDNTPPGLSALSRHCSVPRHCSLAVSGNWRRELHLETVGVQTLGVYRHALILLVLVALADPGGDELHGRHPHRASDGRLLRLHFRHGLALLRTDRKPLSQGQAQFCQNPGRADDPARNRPVAAPRGQRQTGRLAEPLQ
jgi:peptidoglycan/LPS O-acetylase OafA/YrhL